MEYRISTFLRVAVVISVLFHMVISNIHGGTFLAMAGKECVLIASDSRFSSSGTGSMLIGSIPRNIFRVGSRTLIGCFGLDSDARFLMEKVRSKLCMDHTDEHLQPNNIARVVSDILYKNSLICGPIVIGIDNKGGKVSPYICSMDGLGAQSVSDSFAVIGTANAGLYAICESLYQPGLDATALTNIAERCLKLALQRDILSGCAVRIYTMTKDEILQHDFETADV